MTKTKSTKRALVSSALALILCVSMLVGSTYAWFTDSVTSAGNTIQSGTLDVDLVDKDGNSLAGEVLEFVDKDDNALWEPGCTYTLEEVYVENKGNLALKYTIAINGIIGDAKLLEAIDWTVTVNGVKTELADLKGFLLPNTKTDAIVLTGHMKEEAGNEYQDLTVDGISISVAAIQYTYESDSFDDQYDANLEVMTNGISHTFADGSVAFYYNEASGFGGRVRLTALPENIGSEYVVPAEINDLGGALAGVTLDKLTVPAGLEYGYKSLEGAHIDEVVLADGMTTVPNRLFYKAYIGNVVFPDSVTTLAESAFQQAYIDELVVPANVETFGVHAFAGSTLKKITFEGSNLVFDNRPMRECANLRTVVFNCDDVTFMNTTTNGDCWISNKGANGNNYSNITFYVKNTTVAAKVRQAIIHENPATTPIYVNETVFATAKNITELNNALSQTYTDTIVSLTNDVSGNLTFAQNPDGRLVIDGNGHKFDGSITINAESNTTSSGSITIKNVNFKTDATELTFIQSVETNHYPLNVTVSGCTFEGSGAGSDVVAISLKSAKNFVLENCTAKNVHSILQNVSGWDLTVRNVTVTSSGRGLALGTVQGVTLSNVTVEATKYGIRLDAGYNNNAVITDCNVTAFIPVVVRKITTDSNVTFNGTNTMVETNTDNIWCAIGTSEYEKNGELPTDAEKTVTVTVNDLGLDTTGICNNSGK